MLLREAMTKFWTRIMIWNKCHFKLLKYSYLHMLFGGYFPFIRDIKISTLLNLWSLNDCWNLHKGIRIQPQRYCLVPWINTLDIIFEKLHEKDRARIKWRVINAFILTIEDKKREGEVTNINLKKRKKKN